ncbi:MAG: DUF2946 family protein [Pseudomonadota bacterium]|nr:DUF2946 family protein [Pseudomonadota bacterium]
MMAQTGLSLLRLVGVVLAVFSLLVSPAAGEKIEIEQTTIEACAGDAEDGHQTLSAPQDHDDHQHHEHGCGSCHVHVLRTQPMSFTERLVPSMTVAIQRAETPLLAAPSGLFRPPRA